MAFPRRGAPHDLLVGVLLPAKVRRQGNARAQGSRGRATAHAQRDLVVHPQLERGSRPAGIFQLASEGFYEQVVFQRAHHVCIPAGGVDLPSGRKLGLYSQVHGKRQSDCVKPRAEVSRGCRQAESYARYCSFRVRHALFAIPTTCWAAATWSSTRNTSSEPGSSTTGARRIIFCASSSAAEAVASSSLENKAPLWKLIVYSGSFSVCPVSSSTVDSSGCTNPPATSFLSPASVTAEAGSHPRPSAPISAFASAISNSETCSQRPPVLWRALTALRHEAGLPIRIAEARVSGTMASNASPPWLC